MTRARCSGRRRCSAVRARRIFRSSRRSGKRRRASARRARIRKRPAVAAPPSQGRSRPREVDFAVPAAEHLPRGRTQYAFFQGRHRRRSFRIAWTYFDDLARSQHSEGATRPLTGRRCQKRSGRATPRRAGSTGPTAGAAAPRRRNSETPGGARRRSSSTARVTECPPDVKTVRIRSGASVFEASLTRACPRRSLGSRSRSAENA